MVVPEILATAVSRVLVRRYTPHMSIDLITPTIAPVQTPAIARLSVPRSHFHPTLLSQLAQRRILPAHLQANPALEKYREQFFRVEKVLASYDLAISGNFAWTIVVIERLGRIAEFVHQSQGLFSQWPHKRITREMDQLVEQLHGVIN